MTTLFRRRLLDILLLIRSERLKSSSQGAKLLHCSKSTVKRLIKELRDQHIDVVYDKKQGRYLEKDQK